MLYFDNIIFNLNLQLEVAFFGTSYHDLQISEIKALYCIESYVDI